MVNRVLLAGLMLLVFVGAAGAATDVTACGMVVSGAANLVADLDCSSHPGPALVLDGRLDLHGFTLTGNGSPTDGGYTVDCPERKCKIRGPGTIAGGQHGVSGSRVLMTDVTVTGAGVTGVLAGRAMLKGCVITGNGTTPASPDIVRYRGGLWVGNCYLWDTSVVGNPGFGVLGVSRSRYYSSVITGNGFGGCDEVPCVDVVGAEAPLLRRGTTCGTSAHLNGSAFGLCAND